MRYQLLGPLQVTGDAEPISRNDRTPQAAKVKILLAALLIRANEVVSLGQLIDSMWDGQGPKRSKSALHVYVSQLRKFLGESKDSVTVCPVRTLSGGYLIEVATEELDFQVFEELVRQGTEQLESEDYTDASRTLSTALGLWRGPALHGLPGGSELRNFATRMDELRIAAVETRVQADLALGRDRQLVGELLTLVNEHPFRECFYRQLMIALYRSERQFEALRVYTRLRGTLNRELGLEPTPMIRSLQQAILRADQELDPFVSHRLAV